MLLRRFYDNNLAQASYLVGCQGSGEALVVDPNRDVDQYVAAAAAEGVRITHVTETHIHADYVSGSRELAHRTGAALLLSDEGGPDWRYDFADAAGAVRLRDGASFMVGRIRLDVMHTPGHTPEHIAFLVTDTPATTHAMGALTGDFIFVGDVGRPDLLERAARVAGTMEEGARALFASLQRFKRLPDHLQLWPGHGAGSACGKALGAVPQTTLGYERIANWALGIDDEGEFLRRVLEGQPDPPTYFAMMKRVNKEGPRVLGGLRPPPHLSHERLAEVLAGRALVVDTRPAAAYAAGHVPGTINIPLNKSFTTWAGWLVPYDRDVYLLTDRACADCADRAARDLAMIGLDRVVGYFTSAAIDARRAAGDALGTISQISVAELAARKREGDVTVIDVRARSEWEGGHLPGVPNVPLGHLAERAGELPRDAAIVVQCQSGARSSIGASLLRAHGFTDVTNLTGGFAEWQRAGHPVEHSEHALAPTMA